MDYLRVYWQHQLIDEPIELFSELDERRFEARKIEKFRGRRTGLASAHASSNGTRLSTAQLPEDTDIAADP